VDLKSRLSPTIRKLVFKYRVIECVHAMLPVTIKQKVMTVAKDNSFHPLLSEMGIFAERPTRWMLYVR